MGSLYEVLGIPESASQEVLKAAFRKAAMRWHPDRNPGNEKYAAERFNEAKLAYDFLSDPAQRARYDRERAESRASDTSADRTKEDAFLTLLRSLTEAAVTLARQGKDKDFIIKVLVEEGCAANIAYFVADQAMQIFAGRTSDGSQSFQEANSRTDASTCNSGSRRKRPLERYVGPLTIAFVLLAGTALYNLQPGAPSAGAEEASTQADNSMTVAGSAPVSQEDASEKEASTDHLFDGIAPALPILSAQVGAIPPSTDPAERWGTDQDEFGLKLLATVSKETKTTWLKSSTVVDAKQFADDPVFASWWANVPRASNVAIKYIGAREFGGNEAGPLWWIVLFSATPEGVTFDCEQCSPLVSGITMTVDNDGVVTVQTGFVALGSFGRYGTYPLVRQAIAKTPISPDETLLSLHDPHTASGVDSASIRYFEVTGRSMREVLNIVYWSDNSRSLRCSAASERVKCGEYVPKVSWVRESGAHYWALDVEEQGIKPDSDGAALSASGHYRYRFDGLKFHRVDADS